MLTAGHAESLRTSCTYAGANDLTALGASVRPDGAGRPPGAIRSHKEPLATAKAPADPP
jgi:hypothetical protein